MGTRQIRKLEAELTRCLNRFVDCFVRKDTRAHMPSHIERQLSDLPHKSVATIALGAGRPVRSLQKFLARILWD